MGAFVNEKDQCFLCLFCWTIWQLISLGAYVAKAAKEHATEFHKNQNYIISFEYLSHVYDFEYSLYGNWLAIGCLWIWIVMAPGKLLLFHAPLLPLAAHELALWVHVAHTDILCRVKCDMHCNIGRIFWHVNSDFPWISGLNKNNVTYNTTCPIIQHDIVAVSSYSLTVI